MKAAVNITGLTKVYSTLRALNGIDLAVEQGEFFGLLGPNGAGKTTLIQCTAGLTRPTSGRIEVMGYDVVTQSEKSRQMLGVVPQELVFDPFFTVRESLRLQSGYFGIRSNDVWIDEILHHLGLTSKADTNMRALSGGMKRRVLVAQALVHKPPVIVLDEPTAGVDVELRQSLWRFIQSLHQQGHTIILTTHYLEEAQQLCRRIALLKDGNVVANDTTQHLLGQHQQMRCKIKLSTADLPAQLAAHVLEQPSEKNDHTYTLLLPVLDMLTDWLSIIKNAGLHLVSLDIEKPDLEDVFVKLMQQTTDGVLS
jgi:ABC-2 type transport system ATP-binding protein